MDRLRVGRLGGSSGLNSESIELMDEPASHRLEMDAQSSASSITAAIEGITMNWGTDMVFIFWLFDDMLWKV